ncbi:MAG: ABC transporter permease [Chromatiaceae bacterium]|nr:ABC transporter permease [Chromatiaceae bacterium]MCP5437774.1 ABC transporter permease [Chromatiaceae bacterium]HPE80730.1 ABC transporter permease [Gammaproteobacteria bacterium]
MTVRLISQLIDTLIVLFGVSTLVFLLLVLIPGDPVDVVLGESAQAADREAMRAALGLDRPLPERWLKFYVDLAHGDLGDSLVRLQPVTDLIRQRLPATLQLAAAAFVLVLLIAMPLGIIAARHRGRWPDSLAQTFALVGVSIPNFWLGPLLVLLFSVYLGWTPVSGNLESGSLVLPAITLGLSMAAITTRMMRSSLLEIESQPFLRTARCKGLSEGAVMLRHSLPNAMLPVITVLGLQLGGLLAGAVITEVVFSWPGIGSLLVDAIRQRDYPVVQGVVLFIALSYVLVNRLSDTLAAWLDPRIRERA